MGCATLTLGSAARSLAQPALTKAIRLNIDTRRARGRIPDDFTGLGYEILSVATLGLLSDKNRVCVQLVHGLGAQGVIRVGGITSDSASFAPKGVASPAGKATVINSESLRELGGFLDATGWKLIWGLNLGSGNEQSATEEAVAVAMAVKDRLRRFFERISLLQGRYSQQAARRAVCRSGCLLPDRLGDALCRRRKPRSEALDPALLSLRRQ